jgi:hypothetical protein
MSNSSIDVSSIVPEAKDDSRAAKLCYYRGDWHPTPLWGAASKMAQAIDDPRKLVRRSKAVAQRYGANSPSFVCFVHRLRELDFTDAQIKQISASS